MSELREYLGLLGFPVKDLVTGFKGVVTHIGFDLYGCVQAIVSPGLDEKGEVRETRWFDVKRLEQQSSRPVMEVPTFDDVPGGDVLPPPEMKPTRS